MGIIVSRQAVKVASMVMLLWAGCNPTTSDKSRSRGADASRPSVVTNSEPGTKGEAMKFRQSKSGYDLTPLSRETVAELASPPKRAALGEPPARKRLPAPTRKAAPAPRKPQRVAARGKAAATKTKAAKSAKRTGARAGSKARRTTSGKAISARKSAPGTAKTRIRKPRSAPTAKRGKS